MDAGCHGTGAVTDWVDLNRQNMNNQEEEETNDGEQLTDLLEEMENDKEQLMDIMDDPTVFGGMNYDKNGNGHMCKDFW